MKRVIFTTVQNNYEAIKMLELALKSFYAFNSGFDFKVFCLDNSKDKFKEYFDKFEFENLEFINFKDGTKWNNYLEHLERDELTDLERKNMFISDPEMYVFNTNVCISKLEIIDLLLEKYDVVIATDIDVVFGNSIERSLKVFLQSGFFLGADDEARPGGTMSFSAGFMYFNKDAKDRIFNLMDKALYSLTYEDLREIPIFNKTSSGGLKFNFNFFEQDLLDYFIEDYFRLNERIMTTSMKFDLNKVYDVYHFACTFSKPFYEFNKEKISFENNFVLPIRNFYSNLFKLFDVDVDFINKPTKFTTSAVAINRCYNIRLRYIKSNYARALKNNSKLKAFVKS